MVLISINCMCWGISNNQIGDIMVNVASKAEIIAKYQRLHDALTNTYYSKKRSVGVTEQEQMDFDREHAAIWNNCENALIDAGYLTKPSDNKLE